MPTLRSKRGPVHGVDDSPASRTQEQILTGPLLLRMPSSQADCSIPVLYRCSHEAGATCERGQLEVYYRRRPVIVMRPVYVGLGTKNVQTETMLLPLDTTAQVIKHSP